MAKICLGSVVKVTLNVDGLTGVRLTDDSVEIRAFFYGSDNGAKTIEVDKAQMINEEEEPSDNLFCLVDTTSLATGSLTAEIEVKYPVEGTEEKLVQRSIVTPLDSDKSKLTLIKTNITE